VSNILIEGNDVAGQYWGRGIVVSGGRDVTIRRNRVSHTTHSAGILVSSDDYWQTSSVRNVLIEANDIAEVQTTPPGYNPRGSWQRTSQGGVDIHAEYLGSDISDVLIRNNRIRRTYKEGIRVRGNVGVVSLQENVLSEIGREGIVIEAREGAIIGCAGNTLNSAPTSHQRCGQSIATVDGAAF